MALGDSGGPPLSTQLGLIDEGRKSKVLAIERPGTHPGPPSMGCLCRAEDIIFYITNVIGAVALKGLWPLPWLCLLLCDLASHQTPPSLTFLPIKVLT